MEWVVIVQLGGEREREVLDQARMGTDTEVPVLSHGHTQARTQGSWLHSSVPLVATGCGQGQRGAWYTMFIHSQGGKDPGPNHYGSPADPQDVGRVRGAWYCLDLWETLRFPLEGEGHGVRAGDHRRGLLLGAHHRGGDG